MTVMPGDMIAALKLVPENKVDGMFDEIAVAKALMIEGCRTDEERLRVQASISQIREIKNFFKSERAK